MNFKHLDVSINIHYIITKNIMGRELAYKIYPANSVLSDSDDDSFCDFEDVDFNVSPHNSQLSNGEFTRIGLKNKIVSLASSLSENFDNSEDILEALRVYIVIGGEMSDTDIVRIVYE